MKKKTLLLLASSILGLGLIGGTLAGWAVTDNADPFNIKVSPGQINADNETTYITLSWGSSQSMSNVSNLKLNETRRAGVLDLKAETESDEAVNGKLRYKVTASDTSLTQYLHLDVYEGNIPSYASTGTVDYKVNDLVIYNKAVYKCTTAINVAEEFNNAKWTLDASKKVTFESSADTAGYTYKNIAITKTEGQANPYTVIVYLDGSLTQTAYDALRTAGKTADVTFDWGIGDGTKLATTTPIFYKGIADPYIYAFIKGQDDVVNQPWPGVKMTAAKASGYYTYELDTSKYTHVVFNDGNDGAQTEDIAIATLIGSNHNCCETGADGSSPQYSTHDDTLQPEYYLRGKNLTVQGEAQSLDWDANPAREYKLPAFSGDSTTVVVTTTGNAELKFYDATFNTWYSNSDANFTLGQAGTYTLTFTPNGSPVIDAVKN